MHIAGNAVEQQQSLFVANSHTKRFTINIVLNLTYLRTQCVSFVPSLASA